MNTVGIAQIGLGHWGKNLLRNFTSLPEATVLAACDRDEDRLTKLHSTYPDVPFCRNYRKVLDNPDVEAVVIATNTESHFPIARDALHAGKHVFVEKPLTQTVDQAETLVELAEQYHRRLMVGHLLLYHPAFQYVAERIRSGDLGKVHYMYSMRVNLGIIRQKENALQSLAPHDFSVALQYMDNPPLAVSAQGQSYLQPDIEDVTFATVYFERGGMAHVHTSWLDPHKIRKMTVVGSERMAVIDDMEPAEKVRLYDKGVDHGSDTQPLYSDYAENISVRNGDIRIPRIEMDEPLRLECKHFVQCIKSGSRPRTDGRNGRIVVQMLEAAQRSLEAQGAAVEIASQTVMSEPPPTEPVAG